MRATIALVAAFALTTGWAHAEAPVLTVTFPNEGAPPVVLDMAAIEALPQLSFETSTVWTDGVHEFTGPTLASVLEATGAVGTMIRARAVNNYVIEIPVDSIEDTAPIIATRIDGQPFARREKGPLWIIYPFDSDARFQSESVYSRSIWQLVELTVE